MLMFGSGASTYATTVPKGVSRNNEVTATTVPAGHHRSGFSPAILGWLWDDQVDIFFPHSNEVPSTQMQ